MRGVLEQASCTMWIGTAATSALDHTTNSVLAVVPAVVRWQKPDGVGVQFGQLRARDVWALNQLFRSEPE